MLQKISTDKAPAAIGPYSQGIVLGNIFFASGQIPIDPATGEIHGTTIEEQAEQVMKNIGELLKAAGTDYTSIRSIQHKICNDSAKNGRHYVVKESCNVTINRH